MEFKMILVGGENLMDMVEIGENTNNRLFEAIPGGSPYNVAMAIGRQGQKVGYLTPISTPCTLPTTIIPLVDLVKVINATISSVRLVPLWK